MTMSQTDFDLLLVIFVAGGMATYIWRALGVLAAERLDPRGESLRWLGCVANAIVAALCIKLAIAPPDILSETLLITRLGALAAGVAGFYSTLSLAVGVGVSSVTLIIAESLIRPLF